MSDFSLSNADLSSLRSLLESSAKPLSPRDRERIAHVLETASTAPSSDACGSRVGLSDQVSLVSPSDRNDTYEFTVVVPSDEDLDEDRISVTSPICLAVLGHAAGETVSWETAAGTREMKIEAVRKALLGVH